nr:hypothetical protein [Vibrio cidicii]
MQCIAHPLAGRYELGVELMLIFLFITLSLLFVGCFWTYRLATGCYSPFKLAVYSVLLTVYGGTSSLVFTFLGSDIDNKHVELAGQLSLLFFSVVGGSLFSLAITEIRKKSLDSQK